MNKPNPLKFNVTGIFLCVSDTLGELPTPALLELVNIYGVNNQM